MNENEMKQKITDLEKRIDSIQEHYEERFLDIEELVFGNLICFDENGTAYYHPKGLKSNTAKSI